MERLTSDEYYNSERDYYIPSDNVADLKYQKSINEDTTLYGMSEDADQFMLSSPRGDVFFVDCTLAEVLKKIKS